MCGILGSINLPFRKGDLDLIAHRGPDDSGIIDLAVGHCHVMLGHRRLSIVDLSPAGHQPMQIGSGRYSLVFNGEIYNQMTLRQNLKGVEFIGHSDTETILHCIAQKGIGAVKEFNGIFALGFLDSESAKLYLVRDPFGVKPLYYFREGKVFVFASELRPIQRLVKDTMDLDNLAELLRLRYLPSPDTLFSNIRKVRPGHIVEVSLAEFEVLRVKEYPFVVPHGTERLPSYSDAVEQYGVLFEKAVRSQLMSDVEVGILLSGGIDSAMVAAFAQKHLPYRMKAFTVGFTDQDEADEVEAARVTCMHLGLDHCITRIGFDDFMSAMHQCVAIVEEPLATTSLVPMFHLAKLASDHVKVVLSGQGADESLGGYGRYQGELYRSYVPPALVRAAEPIALHMGIRDGQLLRGLKSLGKVDDIDRFLTAYTVFDENEIIRLMGRQENQAIERLRYFYDLLECEKRNDSVERMMAVDLRMNLSDDLLLYTDKITMHHSLECRVPLLDLDLVQFLEALPYYYRVKLRKSKIIHKHFAQRVLPDSIIHRKRKGFLSPTKSWFKNNNGVRDILLDPSSRFSLVFSLPEVNKVLDEHRKGFDRERQIFLLLSIHKWMSEYA